MDARDVKPVRPSLLLGGNGNTASSATGARILADMEGGGRRKTRTARSSRHPLWLMLGTVAIALLAGYHFLASPVKIDDAVVAAAPVSPSTDSARSSLRTDAGDAGTTADAASMLEPFDSLSAHADEPSGFPLPPTPDPKAQAAAGVMPVAARSASTKAARKRAGTAASKRATVRREPPLMASLLNNIEQDQVTASVARSLPRQRPVLPPAPIAAPESSPVGALQSPVRDQSAMDALVQQVSRGDATVAASTSGRTQTVQQALRSCPRANTRAGLRCREKICSQFRGMDQACPN